MALGRRQLDSFSNPFFITLGTGDIVSYQYPVEVPLSALFSSGTVISKIATGRSHTLILLDNGDVYGCGSNAVGQLGLGDSKTALRDALRFVKIPSLTGIRDISCGHEHSLACDRSGRLFTFGHPQYGQLGHGTDGSFIKDGGKGAAMQFRSVFLPRQVEKFVVKDTHGKLVSEAFAADVNIRLVAAGKNHSICVEEWENNGRNKVYSFGFGGYGRLGHNSGTDELYPREIVNPFQCIVAGQQVPPVNHPQKQIVQIFAGSTYTLAISTSRHLYFWGKLSNSQRGEATMYPKMEMNLYGWKSRLCSGGSNSIFVAADDSIMGWGIPVAVSKLVEDSPNLSSPFIHEMH
jgi:alpha-tubulin suppressor-like RCC1 family protein